MKSPHAFRSIGEVARLVGVATHVLRYWETQFPALAPVRRPDGRRYYRPDDLLLAAGLCEVMREDGLTIRGARRLIDMDKGAALRERGRLRLEAALEVQPVQEKVSARRKPNGGTRPTTNKSETTPPAATIDGEGSPLMRDPASVPAVDRSTMNEEARLPGTWLARLNATASALRSHPAPLPPAAHTVAQVLRSISKDRH